jgi:hypothetical protein
MGLSLFLLVLFLFCGLVYARATKALQRLDELRLISEGQTGPGNLATAAANLARRMGMTLAPSGEELRAFCEANGHGETYKRATRHLYGSIAIALLCAGAILMLSPAKP